MKYYRIDGDNNTFPTLKDAKHHCWLAYTPRERRKYLNGSEIYQVRGDEVTSTTPIRVDDDGNLTYGRTVRR